MAGNEVSDSSQITFENDDMERSWLYGHVCNRMNITWVPDGSTQGNVENSIDEAMQYLRGVAGTPTLSFGNGNLRNLCVTCACYLFENKKADFIQEYEGELNMLRLREGFGCGKEES